MNIRRLRTQDSDFNAHLHLLLTAPEDADQQINRRAQEIVESVRLRGDAALLEWTRRLDNLGSATTMAQLEIPREELRAALQQLDVTQRKALEFACLRITEYHEHQARFLARDWQYTDLQGCVLGQQVRPLDRVGVYVPGGHAAYPSSVLMNVLPAKVAGVRDIIMVSPTPHGVRNPFVLAAAQVAGVQRVFCVGGAQAIAALAYGTDTIPRVDKVVGPGNAYVAAAKRLVFGHCGVDMVAGPSEVLIVADGSAPPLWAAMDLMAQAEHDELAQAILVSPDHAYLEQVAQALQQAVETQPRAATIRASLSRRGALIACRDLHEAVAIANRVAPEHLELHVRDAARLLPEIRHAGAVFVGAHASESLGDYVAGPNHVLPTSGTARFSSALGVYDFIKRTSVIQVSHDAAIMLNQNAVTLARGEGLEAHAQAAHLRLEAAKAEAASSATATPAN